MTAGRVPHHQPGEFLPFGKFGILHGIESLIALEWNTPQGVIFEFIDGRESLGVTALD